MVRLRDPREEGRLPPGSPQSVGSGERFAYSTSTLSRLRSRNLDWQRVKDSERHRLGLVFRDQTEFWMPLEDVVAEFSELILCRLVTENTITISGRHKWRVSMSSGIWKFPERSGGGDIGQESFFKNPQYLVDIKDDSEVIVQLLQFHSISGLDSPTDLRNNLRVAFHIIKVEENRETRLHKLWSHCPISVALEHSKSREVNYRGRLPQGRYLLVTSSLVPGDKGLFIIRMFSKTRLNLREAVLDVPNKVPCSCFLPDIELITVITIHKAEKLARPVTWGSGRLDPYCMIICEGVKVKTDIARDDLEPAWDQSFVFFRKKPDQPIVLQLLSHKSVMPDELIGECELSGMVTHCIEPHVVELHPKPVQDAVTGSVHLSLLTEDNIFAV